MVPKSWNTLTLICGNHGEDYSHQMEIFEWSDSKRDAVFYRCPQYQARYGTVSGPFCNNRLTIEDYRFYKHLRGEKAHYFSGGMKAPLRVVLQIPSILYLIKQINDAWRDSRFSWVSNFIQKLEEET